MKQILNKFAASKSAKPSFGLLTPASLLNSIFKKEIAEIARKAVIVIEQGFYDRNMQEKKAKAIQYIVRRIMIPHFLANIPVLSAILNSQWAKIQDMLADFLNKEIDAVVEKCFREMKNGSTTA